MLPAQQFGYFAELIYFPIAATKHNYGGYLKINAQLSQALFDERLVLVFNGVMEAAERSSEDAPEPCPACRFGFLRMISRHSRVEGNPS